MVAVFALQGLELGLVLDALGERLDVECLAELHEGVDECGGRLGGGDAVDERAVETPITVSERRSKVGW